MGERGRKPRPPGEAGTDPAAVAQAKIPECPEGLSERSERFWVWVIEELTRLKRFTPTDVPALEEMIVVYELLQQAKDDVLENGRTITIHAKTGDYKQTSPSVAQIKTFSDQLRKWYAEFGLTPSGRGSKHNQPKPGSEELAAFNKELG